jgi:hypothetical protein
MEDRPLEVTPGVADSAHPVPRAGLRPTTLKEELEAISAIGAALDSLDANGRQRALNFIANRYALSVGGQSREAQRTGRTPSTATAVSEGDEAEPPSDFEDIGALYEAAGPSSNPERALVAAYWFQVIEGQQDFGSQQLNNALKNLGHGIEDITNALERLKGRKPSLIRQLQKSGSSRQARKTYKITDAGINAVRDMFGGEHSTEE